MYNPFDHQRRMLPGLPEPGGGGGFSGRRSSKGKSRKNVRGLGPKGKSALNPSRARKNQADAYARNLLQQKVGGNLPKATKDVSIAKSIATVRSQGIQRGRAASSAGSPPVPAGFTPPKIGATKNMYGPGNPAAGVASGLERAKPSLARQGAAAAAGAYALALTSKVKDAESKNKKKGLIKTPFGKLAATALMIGAIRGIQRG